MPETRSFRAVRWRESLRWGGWLAHTARVLWPRRLSLLVVLCGACAAPRADTEVVESPTAPEAKEAAEVDASSPDEAPVELVELGTGVWAALQPTPLRFTDANSLWVATEQGSLVVDAPTDPRTVAYTIEAMRERGMPAPRWLVYTHWHLDHTLGAAQLRAASSGEFEVYGHAALVETDLFSKRLVEQHEELKAGLKEAGRDELLEQVSVELLAPDHAVRDALELELGGLPVVLHPVAAHTDGDLLVEFPRAKLWASGDVLDDLPFAGHGHPSAWPAALELMHSRGVERVVPGHGSVYEGSTHLSLMLDYWRELLGAVRAAHDDSELEALTEAMMASDSRFKRYREALVVDGASERAFAAWFPEALKMAWAELEASPAQPSDAAASD